VERYVHAIISGSNMAACVSRQPDFTLGRGAACDARFDHPSVSKVHAKIVVGADAIFLQDLRFVLGL
jgi:hypothetical protein